MGWPEAGAIFGGSILSGLSGWMQGKAQERMSDKNLAFQQQVFNYQKDMQQAAWKREDSAVQRRVGDLRAAGLSPVLAAGSGASSSAPISVNTPQATAGGGEAAAGALSGIGQGALMAATLSQTKAGAEAARAQSRKTTTDEKLSRWLVKDAENNYDWNVLKRGREHQLLKEQIKSTRASGAASMAQAVKLGFNNAFQGRYGFDPDEAPEIAATLKALEKTRSKARSKGRSRQSQDIVIPIRKRDPRKPYRGRRR